ncbi:HemA [Desulforapulum autotrophicum HRM2]|uniref:Glutamyl-tRNA reductase n=1 Tax=Desulforapulum autotrophicum (strain ATCC 43914 / DSM 3382 / VKM B-1955 / HRM2) TaxID=177437 RepID=C0QLB3_DESAH|nr:glutamyl-tRNA reductase [Desulforapulum autotrophicum]ACN14199.1 HemA [Desulforapulum autotrophicum HRM2]
MPEIILIGLNHKTAPVSLRECLSFPPEQTLDALETLLATVPVKEALIFSTCNRMEILFVPGNETATDQVVQFLSDYKALPIQEFEPSLYTYRNDDAVKHLFRVAASLDSMIVGEPQILGQIKKAYRKAIANKASGTILNRLMHKAFSVAKRVRKETGIGDNAVSISYAAVELANKIFSDLDRRSVMLMGAGEMAELAVEHLISNGVKQIIVANRTFANAVCLAQRFQGQAIKFEEMETFLCDVDIIISSTGATQHVLTKQQVKKAMAQRKNRPLFCIDIAVPRDLDPGINQINNAYLYDIDDLQNLVNDNLEERSREAVKGERLVEEAVVKFRWWLDSLAVVPTIKDLKRKLESIADKEAEKTITKLGPLAPEQIDAIKRLTRSVARKIMHDPILFLKNTGEHRNDAHYLSVARHLFNLDPGFEDNDR